VLGAGAVAADAADGDGGVLWELGASLIVGLAAVLFLNRLLRRQEAASTDPQPVPGNAIVASRRRTIFGALAFFMAMALLLGLILPDTEPLGGLLLGGGVSFLLHARRIEALERERGEQLFLGAAGTQPGFYVRRA
jgi:hypothetical protein